MRGKPTVLDTGRHLSWEACYNARDLGGLPLEDGRKTRRRAVIRSDTLGRLTPAGRQALIDYGVRTIIDLRSPQEIAADPYDFNGRDAALQHLNLPLDKHEPHASALMDSAPTLAAMYIVMLDYCADAVTAVMAAIAHAQPGGIVIHCSAGKDRTGIVAALLLRLNGVTTVAIGQDYAATQARLWRCTISWSQKLATRSRSRAVPSRSRHPKPRLPCWLTSHKRTAACMTICARPACRLPKSTVSRGDCGPNKGHTGADRHV